MMKHSLLFLFLSIGLFVNAQDRVVHILHTSDTHSCIEPIASSNPDRAQAGNAGFVRRAAVIDSLRMLNEELLLLDCGDFSQGSVYFNLFRGDVEIRLMNEMKYDAATLGNHEFDFGLENLARMVRMAKFPFVCCNYDFTGTPCEGLIKPYIVVERAGIRVGILGVCPQPKGLITAANYLPMKYLDPVTSAQPIIDKLRNVENCDVIVCLSHLGWLEDLKDYDPYLISHTTGIDVLLGGHTHTYFEHPATLRDASGHEVLIDHEGKNGLYIGYLEVKL